MRISRISLTSVLLITGFAWVILAFPALAQQRPGIQPFVYVPEGCSLAQPPDTESLFSFTKTQIQALWMARRGERANVDVLASGDELPTGLMAEMIRGMREERIEDTCAAFIVSAYTGSQNESTATVAKILSSAYQQLGVMTDQMLGIALQGTLAKNQNIARDRLLEWKNKRLDILENMTETLNLSLSMLVDPKRKDPEGKPDHLVLTRAQRDELLKLLSSKFPTLESDKKVAHASDFITQAALIQAFLTGSYKPADSQ